MGAILKAAVVACVIVATEDAAPHALSQGGIKPRFGACEREAEKLVGQKAARIGDAIVAPKKRRTVRPRYPELPPGTIASGMWTGEALVDVSGRVVQVWPVREVRLKPPFPAFNTAIAESIRRWEFEPLLVNGTPAPFCVTVTTNIDFV